MGSVLWGVGKYGETVDRGLEAEARADGGLGGESAADYDEAEGAGAGDGGYGGGYDTEFDGCGGGVGG